MPSTSTFIFALGMAKSMCMWPSSTSTYTLTPSFSRASFKARASGVGILVLCMIFNINLFEYPSVKDGVIDGFTVLKDILLPLKPIKTTLYGILVLVIFYLVILGTANGYDI